MARRGTYKLAMILKGNDLGYAYEACLLASFLGERDFFTNSSRDSDIMSRFIHLFEKDFDLSLVEYVETFRY